MAKRFGKLDLEVMQSNAKSSDKVVFAALRLFENPKTGQCNPSLSVLAKTTNIKKQNVSKSLQRLIIAGFIEATPGKNNSKNYTLVSSVHDTQVSSVHDQVSSVHDSSVIKVEPLSSLYKEKTIEKTIEKTPLPPSEKIVSLVPAEDRSKQSELAQEFLTAWNEALPRTVPGADQRTDQNSIITLLTEYGKSLDELHAILAFVASEGKAKYWPRPANLLRHTGKNGPYVFAQIETELEANHVETTQRNTGSTPEQRKADISRHFDKLFAEYGTDGEESTASDTKRLKTWP